MFNYELRPKLVHLTLCGQDEEGNLEFLGNEHNWTQAVLMQNEMEDTITKAKDF